MIRAKFLGWEWSSSSGLSRVKARGPVPCLSLVAQNSAFLHWSLWYAQNFFFNFVIFMVDFWSQYHLKPIVLILKSTRLYKCSPPSQKPYSFSLHETGLHGKPWTTVEPPELTLVHPSRVSRLARSLGTSLSVQTGVCEPVFLNVAWRGHPGRPCATHCYFFTMRQGQKVE